jgi:flagellar biosynthesis/type III secretory pathway chaperone
VGHCISVIKGFVYSLSDLQTIEDRVNQQYYSKLSEFVGDVMRIFENCRFFNQPNSAILKSAIALEAFFAQKLSALRQKIAET